MSAQFTVDIDKNDLGEVEATLELEAKETTSQAERIIAKHALLITRDAKRNAPVDTGRLRASIIPEIDDLEATVEAGGSEIVGTNVDYAAVQEFGNLEGGIEGSKYMTRAWNANKDDFEKEIKSALGSFGT